MPARLELDDKRIADAYLSGMPLLEIARQFNVSRPTISKRLKEAVIYGSLKPKIDIEREDAIYLAGLLEGEGCFSITRRTHSGNGNTQYSAVISVGMTDKEPIYWAAEVWNGKVSKDTSGRDRPLYSSVCPVRNIPVVSVSVLPFLKSKRKESEVGLVLKLQGTKQEHGYNRPVPISTLKYRNWLWEEMQRTREWANG